MKLLSFLAVPLVISSIATFGQSGLTGTPSTLSLGGNVTTPTTLDFNTSSTANFLIKKGTANYLTILNGGSIGIGTSNPLNLVHVYGAAQTGALTALAIDNRHSYGVGTGFATARMIFSISEPTVPDPNYRVMGYIEAGHLSETSSTPGFLAFGTRTSGAATEKMRITDIGNVGIGTISPLYKLDVTGTARFTGDLTTNLTTGSIPFIGVSGVLSQDNTNLFWDNTNKRLGIGTITPNSSLSIVAPGTNNSTIYLGAAGNTTYATTLVNKVSAAEPFYLTNSFSGKVFGVKGNLVTSGQFDTYLNSYYNLAFTTGTQDPLISDIRMFIQQNGKIGIGTTAPSEKLDVNGNIYTNGKLFIGTSGLNTGTYSLAVNGSAIFTKAVVRLTTAPWPDYVFEPHYKLLPLNELESFLLKNKHLPDVPSALEVQRNGIDLGDNQTLLLKKIEELTLYIIELGKKNGDMQKQINQLTADIRIQKKMEK